MAKSLVSFFDSRCITVILSFYRVVLVCIIVYHAYAYCIDFTGV